MKRSIFLSAFLCCFFACQAQFDTVPYNAIYDQMHYNSYEKPRIEKHEQDSLKRIYRKQYPLPPLNGFYLKWGLGFGMIPDNTGAIGIMIFGTKLFFPPKSKHKTITGLDVSGFIAALGFSETSGYFGINFGPSFAWRLRKGNLYLTPYTGVNLGIGKGGDASDSLDISRKYIDYGIPIGLKLEYQHRMLFIGCKADLGFANTLDDKGLYMTGSAVVFAGLKFYKKKPKKKH